MKQVLRIGVTAVAIAAGAGCAQSETAGRPMAEPPGPTDETRQSAPHVPRPLDAGRYLTDPCASLTAEQLRTFRVSRQGQVNPKAEGPSCIWRFGGPPETTAGVSYYPQVPNGLTNLYHLQSAGYWQKGYFEPTTISGQPALYSSVIDNRQQGECELAVALTDQLFFSVLITEPPGKPSCKAAENIAEAVIQTISGGG
ncbi:DUF3558 domain-containing protein [Amycolatopsis suaedae]|uniref:DUF3558 domain-containing protein n=1 Tax=Amycolatopsis suaedae TaxID=2510978 RepID=A0A4Q7J020_9PSEU|nr:DUF3558 domain-containing protein [Amycolatopsis suaedae]RZQ59264.1 DUF3558 domain-containing protein [Amycolatopsis suaedae]